MQFPGYTHRVVTQKREHYFQPLAYLASVLLYSSIDTPQDSPLPELTTDCCSVTDRFIITVHRPKCNPLLLESSVCLDVGSTFAQLLLHLTLYQFHRHGVVKYLMDDMSIFRQQFLGGVPRITIKCFYVKLNFEIAVDQKGGTQIQTFEGVLNTQCRISRAMWPRPILAQKYQIRHTRSKPSKWVLY